MRGRRRMRGLGLVLGAGLLLTACTGVGESVPIIVTPGASASVPASTPVDVQIIAAPPVAENENPEPIDDVLFFSRGQWATVLGASGEPVGRFSVTGLAWSVQCLEPDAPKAAGDYVAIQVQVEGYSALEAEGGAAGFAPAFDFDSVELLAERSDDELDASLADSCISSEVQDREYELGVSAGYLVFDVPAKGFDLGWSYGDQTFRFVNLDSA